MESNSFLPKITPRADSISVGLMAIARFIIIIAIGLLPLFFIPGSLVFINTTKVFFVVLLLLVAVIFTSLGILRRGSIMLSFSPVLLSWWAVVLAAFVSAVLSPTLKSSLVGNSLEIQTVGFLFLLGMIMTSTIIFADYKKGLVYVYGAFILGAVLLSLFQLVHIFSDASFLSLGFLQGNTATIIGGFNDLGIFVCLAIILSLITLVQLPLPTRAVSVLAVCVVIMLALLAIINFFVLWVVLSLLSLSLLMYYLTKDRYSSADSASIESRKGTNLPVTGLIAFIFIVSAVFLVGGNSLAGYISASTGVSYVEVRPSVTATLDIMRNVYHENAFTGIGPNRFVDAWNLHKDNSINQTIFWNTTFSAGSGYVPTWFVTTGIFGVLAWFIFFVLFIYTGIKMLIQGQETDRFWYYIGTISFVTSLFVWVMSIIYVPGPVILIVGAFSTGIVLVARRSLLPGGQRLINLLTSARTGFVLISLVMVVIISAVAVGYGAVRQFTAYNTYANITKIPAGDEQLATVLEYLDNANNLYPADVYARDRAGYQLLNINYLLTLSEPTADDKQKLQDLFAEAILDAKTAINQNRHDVRNWSTLGDIYAVLATLNYENASTSAKSAFDEARKLDPQNPYYDLQEAAIAFRTGDNIVAREKAIKALQLKQNYTDALFLISQIDIASGDIEKAIASSEVLVILDPSNPGRHYQLGVLQAANNKPTEAINSFTKAITLNPSYANALYLRAQQYLVTGEKEKAISDLRIVQNLNPDNSLVEKVINEINQGNINPSIFNAEKLVTEPNSVVTENQVTTTNEDPQTDLIKPVNATSAEKPSTENSAEIVSPENTQ